MDNPALIVDRPDLTIVDSNALPWEEHPGKTGVWWKVLAHDANGDPAVSLQWFPPDGPDTESPRRYHHLTVGECAYVLGGERPVWEYESANQSTGQRVLLREGHWVDRKPGSIHGFEEATATPPFGCLFLVWQTGPGLLKGERGYEEETVPVPFPPEPAQ